MRRLPVLLALCLLGCGNDPPQWWGIDHRFTDEETTAITSCMVVWNSATAKGYTMMPATNPDLVDAYIVRERPALGYNGTWSSAERLLRIAPALPPTQVARVACHELGHALGLGHTDHGVMNPNHSEIEPSDEDKTECRDVGVCK